jgi:hypothetical protein
MAEEPRFSWPAIFRVVGIVVGVTAAVGLVIPLAVTPAFKLYNTGVVAGNEIYQWAFWVVAWALTIWQGAWMLRRVGDKIIDDMLVVSLIAAPALVVIKLIIAFAYQPIGSDGQPLTILTAIDAGGALMLIVVALVGARINKY